MNQVLRRSFALAALGWAAALPLATWIASRPNARAVPYSFALGVYGLGAWICHQRPDRSFYLWAMQMPVCARCTGIYVGAAGAIVAAYVARVAAAFAPPSRSLRRARRLKPRATLTPLARLKPRAMSIRTVLVVAALPTILTLAFEWASGIPASNALRGLAGLPLGAALVWVVLQAEVN